MAKKNHLDAKDRRLVASKLMTWANLVFGGLVVTQAFLEKFNEQVAFAGVGLFVGAYVVSVRIMRGGDA